MTDVLPIDSVLSNEQAARRVRSAIGLLLGDPSLSDPNDRRAAQRRSYFREVKLLPQGDEAPVSAFVRDISPLGIGLLHLMPLERGAIEVLLPAGSGEVFRLAVHLSWCQYRGEGWYATGGVFLDVEVKEP